MRRIVWACRVVIVAALVGAGALAMSGVAGAAPAVGAGAAPAVPYTDPGAVGYVGLCNQSGQQVTTGSLSDAPFVFRAVSSQPAPAPYNGPSRTAILVAYLPIQGLPPGDWSGAQLTASSRYSNAQSPMAQATAKDISLGNFIGAFPPKWDGYIQLRMDLGAANQPAYVRHYPALNIYVSGATWTAVGGGPVNCNAGSAESFETIVEPTSTTVAAGSGAHNSGAGGGSATSGTGPKGGASSGSGGSAAGKNSNAGGNAGGTVAVDQPASSSHSTLVITGLIVLLFVLALAATFIVRRLRAPAP